VANQDQFDVGVHQGVEERHGRTPRVAEDVFDSFPFETLDELLGASWQFGFHFVHFDVTGDGQGGVRRTGEDSSSDCIGFKSMTLNAINAIITKSISVK
jgi:hypothetical protein